MNDAARFLSELCRMTDGKEGAIVDPEDVANAIALPVDAFQPVLDVLAAQSLIGYSLINDLSVWLTAYGAAQCK